MTDPAAADGKNPDQEAVRDDLPEPGSAHDEAAPTDEPRSDEPSSDEPSSDEPSGDEPAGDADEPADDDGPAGDVPGPVAFSRGVAAAADPDPTPVVVTAGRSTHEYGEPVDPWAGHPAGYSTQVDGPCPYPREETPKRSPRRRTWLFALLAATVTMVLAVATAAVVWFWPRYPALDFERLAQPARFAPALPVTSAWADASVVGDRIYFGNAGPDGRVAVSAVDGAATDVVWSSTAAGRSERWTGMEALASGVALSAQTGDKKHPSKVVMLGAANGDLRWTIPLGPNDRVIHGRLVTVHVDQVNHQLIGLDATSGAERWRLPDLTANGTRTLAVGAAGDLNGPSSGRGRPFSPTYADPRLVQINPDHSVRVVDLNSGTVGQSWQTGAAADDEVFAHNGRLIVRESGNVRRVVSYDLSTGSPTVLFTAEPDVDVSRLTPCGDDAVCFAKTLKDAGMHTVVRIGLDGSAGWESGALTDVLRMFPVGDAVLVQSRATNTLIDAKGAISWTHPGTVARLDSGNVLRFGHVFTDAAIDESLSGQHIGDEPVELGAVYGVRTATCAWTTKMLGCVSKTDYLTQRFAR
jgi:hypothetical protein